MLRSTGSWKFRKWEIDGANGQNLVFISLIFISPAIGLTDHVWSYREYIWLPVYANPALTQQLDDRIRQLLTPALQDQPRGRTQAAFPPAEAHEVHEEEVGTMPKAA